MFLSELLVSVQRQVVFFLKFYLGPLRALIQNIVAPDVDA